VQEVEAAGAAGVAGAQAGLSAMTALYGATRVERHAAGLMRVGLINAADLDAVRAAVNGACRQLGSSGAVPALRLCQAFAIPDHLLAAPIAFNWRGMVGDKLQ
jgi:acyl-CoA oxidase